MQAALVKPGTPEWHAERKLGIGGSDMAAALGLSKWKTPHQLYLEKIGEAEDQEENWAMAQGKAMEPLLRQHFADTTGLEVRLPTAAMVHPKYPFIRYNPDGLSLSGAVKILAEYKTSRFAKGWGEAGSDEIPSEYIIQIQTGLACSQYDVAKCSVSISGAEPKYYDIEPDKELQEMIEEGAAGFWDKVQNRIPPDPINNEDVARRYSKVNGQTIVADTSPDSIIGGAIRNLICTREEIKKLETQKEMFEVAIKSFMGENEVLADENMIPLITWKQAAGARRIDAEALRDNYPDIAASVTKIGEPTRRFLVK